jgi:HAD superfamily hydrolase (TIGR01490 family)
MTTDLKDHIVAILRGPSGPEVGAFFDFDGTLVDGFSVTAFLGNLMRHMDVRPWGMLRGALATSPLSAYRLASTGLRAETADRDLQAVYDFALSALAGQHEQELHDLGERVFTEGLAARLRHGAWALVQAHLRKGHTVVLVSAATRYQLRPMADRLGVEHILCSTPETVGGRLTGRLAKPLLRGQAKAEAVVGFASDHGIDLLASHAYADTCDDVPFLKAVGRPAVVNPHRRMARVAAQESWPVLCMDGHSGADPIALARTVAACGGVFTGLAAGIGAGLFGVDGRHAAENGVRLASDLSLGLAGVRLEVKGTRHLWTHRPAVFLFNHQSALDLPIAVHLLQGGCTGLVKTELGHIPGLAQALRLMDWMFVDRGAANGPEDLLAAAIRHLAEGRSLAIAAEGTRSLTPTPGPFKHGAFLIARRAGVPVVPVVIRNSGRLMAKSARTIRSGRVDVCVHPAIDVSSWKARQIPERVEEVHRLYVDTIAGWETLAMNEDGPPGGLSSSDPADGGRDGETRRPAGHSASPAHTASGEAT